MSRRNTRPLDPQLDDVADPSEFRTPQETIAEFVSILYDREIDPANVPMGDEIENLVRMLRRKGLVTRYGTLSRGGRRFVLGNAELLRATLQLRFPD